MNTNDFLYEDFEAKFDPMRSDRQARRSRKPKARHIPKKQQGTIVEELVDDAVGLEGGFQTTYTPSRYETEWLLGSIRAFYDQAMITDVLGLVKGGKEASVYRCEAHESTGEDIVAAKVYRPRKFRQLRNDAMYREGRSVLSSDGGDITQRDKREHRAMQKKSAFGKALAHTSWLMHEYTTLERLYEAGAAVPRPFAMSENAILMSYIGDVDVAAPTLSTVRLQRDDARPLFQEVLRNIELMLMQDLIHGDLSAYNILYWDGEITLIDFPQVVSSQNNRNAHMILHRDITRICEYFAGQGVKADPDVLTNQMWDRYSRAIPDLPYEDEGEDEA